MAENMEKHRWVKWPEPGQIRGDGTWVSFDSLVQNHGAEEDDWSYYKATGYLPTHEGPTPPEGT